MRRNEIEERSVYASGCYDIMVENMSKGVVDGIVETHDDPGRYYYYQITEISKLWELREKPLWNLFSEALITLNSVSAPVSFVFTSDGKSVKVYLGTLLQYFETVIHTFRGVLPQMKYQVEEKSDNNKKTYKEVFFSGKEILVDTKWTDGGFLKGNPTGTDDYNFSGQLERVIHGMGEYPWQIAIFASPVSRMETLNRHRFWMGLATENSLFSDVSYTDSETLESTSFKKNYMHSTCYYEKILEFCDKMQECVSVGEWEVNFNFASTNSETARLLGGLLTSAYYGEKSVPEPVHAVFHQKKRYNCLINGTAYTHRAFGSLPYPEYGNRLSSYELAVYVTPPVVDTAGITVKDYVEFDVNRPVKGDASLGFILEHGEVTQNQYRINLNDLNRHCLIIGLTGSGKTNTIKSLIHSAGKSADKQRPFMVIEPAKKEYWELYKLGFSDMRIYSVGSSDPEAHPLCINPFERVVYTDNNGNRHSVSIQTHIDFVYAAFKASFIMYTPMPYVLEKAIYSIYEDCGWDIGNNINKNNKEIYPTIEDLYFKIPQIIEDMGYDTRMRHDLTGSLQARINSLRIGSKGAALNVSKSFSMKHLLEGNTIIELEDIGDDDVRAFIISLLLMRVLEYRRQQEDCHLEVRHVLFIEEAHRLLKNVQSSTGENADPRGAAVEFFCNMLAELRSKGQGFIVADQIPSKLAPDLIKNTNLKIVHRTVSEDERRLMGGAMNMTQAQIDALSTLKQGVAAVYSEGDTRPKLVKPPYAGEHIVDSFRYMSRQDVLSATRNACIDIRSSEGYQMLTDKKCAICRNCMGCIGCKPEAVFSSEITAQRFVRLARSLDPKVIKTCRVENVEKCVRDFIAGNYFEVMNNKNVKNCLIAHMLDSWGLKTDDETRLSFERVYIKNYMNGDK